MTPFGLTFWGVQALSAGIFTYVVTHGWADMPDGVPSDYSEVNAPRDTLSAKAPRDTLNAKAIAGAINWKVDDRVRHFSFGEGRVTHVFGTGSERAVAVTFADGNAKIFDPYHPGCRKRLLRRN